MSMYKNIKNRELPVLLRAIYEANGGDMEQTAHDLESVDLMLGTMKMRSLINKQYLIRLALPVGNHRQNDQMKVRKHNVRLRGMIATATVSKRPAYDHTGSSVVPPRHVCEAWCKKSKTRKEEE